MCGNTVCGAGKRYEATAKGGDRPQEQEWKELFVEVRRYGRTGATCVQEYKGGRVQGCNTVKG